MNTTVDSRWYRTPVEVTAADGGKLTLTEPGERHLKNVMQIRHDGLEYRFPVPTPLVIEIANRRVDWTVIQPSYKNQRPVEGKVLTIYLDHGVKPRNADYCFQIAPVGDTAKLSRLSGDAGCHAVFDPAGKSGAALFYSSGKVELPGFGTLEAAQPSAVLIRDGVLYAADPMQQNKMLRFRLKGRTLEVALPQGVRAGESVRLPL